MTDETGPAIEDEAAELRDAPVEIVLGAHVLGLLRLAAVHLAATPPELEPARLAIDVVGAMVAAGGERLGEHVDLYRQALAEVQQVYVRAAAPTPPEG
ncbi:MAG TPA: hypothetical protein VGS61_08360 [Acidimicrobiales bacterium]|nr:hypothetical protein [Acidimicrobiales bacterium]